MLNFYSEVYFITFLATLISFTNLSKRCHIVIFCPIFLFFLTPPWVFCDIYFVLPIRFLTYQRLTKRQFDSIFWTILWFPSSVYIEVFLPCLSLNVSVVLVDYNAKRSESLVHVYLGWGEGGGRRLLFLEVYYLAPCVICCWPEIFFITLKCNVFILLLLFAILLNYFFFQESY